MKSKKSHEGYLLIDNSNAPPLPDWMLRASGLPSSGKFEGAIITCSHCQCGVILEPRRTRERAYCSKCDHYICDNCGAVMALSGECGSIERKFDEIQEQAALAQQRGVSILLTGDLNVKT